MVMSPIFLRYGAINTFLMIQLRSALIYDTFTLSPKSIQHKTLGRSQSFGLVSRSLPINVLLWFLNHTHLLIYCILPSSQVCFCICFEVQMSPSSICAPHWQLASNSNTWCIRHSLKFERQKRCCTFFGRYITKKVVHHLIFSYTKYDTPCFGKRTVQR